MFNWKFIKVSTITFILFTVFSFFWHNNLFPQIYYSNAVILDKAAQNIWYMNFANALLVYGFVYFVFKAIKPDTKALTLCIWGVYYNISAIGFLNFLAMGLIPDWGWNIVITDLAWAVTGGITAGGIVYYLYRYSK